MSIRTMILAAGILALATSCSAPASPPAASATATSAPSATAAAVTLTPAATATAAPAATGTATASPTAQAAATPTAAATASGGDFVPRVRSVWDTVVGLDQMRGTCARGSRLPVYGLVQITPNGDTLVWKNQEPAPYTMKRLQTNEYQYAGPSAIKDGVVTMTVTFNDAKTLHMQREFVANADPACMHTNVYTGTFQWEKP